MKKLSKLLLSFMIVICLIGFKPVDAAGKTMTMNKTYTIKLNGKKVKYKMTKKNYKNYYKIFFYVNGKKKYTYKDICNYRAVAYLVNLKNKKSVFLIKASGMDAGDRENFILDYYKSKFRKVKNINLSFDSNYINSIKKSGNTLIVNSECQFYSMGYFKYTFKYKYKNGKFKRVSNTTKTFSLYYSTDEGIEKTKYATVARTITTYKTAGGAQKGYLYKYDEFKAKKFTIKGKVAYLYVEDIYSGETGWINASKEYSMIDLEDEGLYAFTDIIYNAHHYG